MTSGRPELLVAYAFWTTLGVRLRYGANAAPIELALSAAARKAGEHSVCVAGRLGLFTELVTTHHRFGERVRSKRYFGRRMRYERPADPTPKEIAQRASEVQATWSRAEERRWAGWAGGGHESCWRIRQTYTKAAYA